MAWDGERTYKWDKDSFSLEIIKYKSKTTLKLPENRVGRVRATVAKGLISLDDKHGLIG